MPEEEDNDWLRPRVMQCPDCVTFIFKVDRSPMLDSWRLYCDRCPQSVEVSYYDPVAIRIADDCPLPEKRAELFKRIERQLKGCACGGRFRVNAARRCHECGFAVTDDPGADLYIFLHTDDSDRDPTDAEQAEYDEWERRFIEMDDLWR